MIMNSGKIWSKILSGFHKMISFLEKFMNKSKTILRMNLMKMCIMIHILEELLKMLRIGHIKINGVLPKRKL